MSRVFSVPFTTLLRERGGGGHGLIRNNKGAFVNGVACKCSMFCPECPVTPPGCWSGDVESSSYHLLFALYLVPVCFKHTHTH